MIAAWGALLRLARRDIRRGRGRALLVVALVALPVLGLVVQGTLRATVQPTPSEVAARELGSADLAGYATAMGSLDALRGSLPPDAEVAPVWRGAVQVGDDGAAAVEAIGVDLTDLGAGMVEVVDGRAPMAAGEITLTAATADRLDADLGTQVNTDLGRFEVIGVLRDPVVLDRELAVLHPDSVPTPSGLLVDLPTGASAADVAQDAQAAGGDAVTFDELARPDDEQTALNLVAGGLVFLLTGFVTAAAFAVSAQRRRHDLALLAAIGADARHLRRTVFASAIVLGGTGATLGAAGGLAVSAAGLPWLEGWTNRAVDGLAVQPVLLVAGVATGLAAAVAAAWTTAHTAARTPVAAALTGRRPPASSSTRLLWGGVAGIALGGLVTAGTAASAATSNAMATAFGLLGGAALVMLGLGAVSPWLVERAARLLASRLPVGPRLALRDIARFRSRTGPIVMAIVAGLGLSVAVGAALGGIERGLAQDYRPWLAEDQLLVSGPAAAPLVDQLRATLPVKAAAPLTFAEPEASDTASRTPPVVALGDQRVIAALGAPPPAGDALESGAVLVLRQSDQPSTGRDPAQAAAALGEVRVVELDLVPRTVPAVVLTRQTFDASGVGIARESSTWLLRTDGPLTDTQIDQAQQLAGRTGQRIQVETGPMNVDTATIQTVAVIGTGVLSLLIVAVGLALIGAETRRDDTTLHLVGAAPGTRRTLTAARAGILTLLGGLLAVPAGLLPIWGLTSTTTGTGAAAGTIAVPWGTIGAVVILVPAAVTIAAYAAAGATRPRLRSRRV